VGRKKVFLFSILFVLLGAIYWVLMQTCNVPVLRIGISAYSGREYFILAYKQGFFEKAGMHVKIVEFGSLEDAQQAFEWHQIDGIVCSLVDAMVIHQKAGVENPKIVLISSFHRPEFACHLMTKTNIRKLSEVRGKKIGVEINSFGGYVLAKALASEGLTLSDVNIVPMDPTAAFTFLTHERVDGVVTYPPFSKPLKERMAIHSLYSTAHWPKEMQLNVLLMSSKALCFHLTHLRRFVKLWDDLLDLYKNNSEYYNHLLALHYSVSDKEARESFGAVYPLSIGEQIPLFCSNRYVLDVMNDIKDKVLLNNNLRTGKSNEDSENILDVSLLRPIKKQ
jgi:NitT/TauT family transport system substrate-binding protein